MPGLTRYGYREVIGGFFEFPTENARRILPPHIEPAELHHGTSIFAMNVFDFTESMVGPYKEAVMAVIVTPLVKPGERLPKSAFYPYLVATTTRAAREHAIERWHLPHWLSDVEIDFEQFQRHTVWDKPGGLANRSGAGDLDVVVYSARKWCRLALAGNPTVLLALFVPDEEVVYRNEVGAELVDNAHRFVSKLAATRFIGYLHPHILADKGFKSRVYTIT